MIALHVPGMIITHLQEYKATVTTASGNRYTVLFVCCYRGRVWTVTCASCWDFYIRILLRCTDPFILNLLRYCWSRSILPTFPQLYSWQLTISYRDKAKTKYYKVCSDVSADSVTKLTNLSNNKRYERSNTGQIFRKPITSYKIFNVSLTVQLSITLANDQLDAKIF